MLTLKQLGNSVMGTTPGAAAFYAMLVIALLGAYNMYMTEGTLTAGVMGIVSAVLLAALYGFNVSCLGRSSPGCGIWAQLLAILMVLAAVLAVLAVVNGA